MLVGNSHFFRSLGGKSKLEGRELKLVGNRNRRDDDIGGTTEKSHSCRHQRLNKGRGPAQNVDFFFVFYDFSGYLIFIDFFEGKKSVKKPFKANVPVSLNVILAQTRSLSPHKEQRDHTTKRDYNFTKLFGEQKCRNKMP